MMHLFINSLAASAGGGLTYIRNVLPLFAPQADVRITVAASSALCDEFGALPQIDFIKVDVPVARRFWYEQSQLPRLIRASRADILLSAGNFALRKSPVPQVLLSRNSVYVSPDFYRDLLQRGEYRTWLDTRLRAIAARRSIRWADVTVAPSQAFADDLMCWTGLPVRALHHGFNYDAFTRDHTPLKSEVERKLAEAEGSIRLLFVSHYNYYRNFETLIRALPLLRGMFPDRPIKLLLTCQLADGKNPGAYRANTAAELVRKLRVSEMVAELGTVPYAQLHLLYRRAAVYVSPAYTETFAAPLVEAMASGVPVVASDIPVHREICGEAGLYFPKFSADQLAQTLAQVIASPFRAAEMSEKGLQRSREFSWKHHVEKILELARELHAKSA